MNLNDQREFLRSNNLEMTKKLDKIIEEAKPKPIIEKRPIIPKRIIISQDITGTPEYKATQQLSDLLLTQSLNNIITGAMNSISGKSSEKDTKVSQEVQDDFRAMNPVEVGDEKRLYYDVPIPTLPDPNPIPYYGRFNTEEEFVVERERLLVALDGLTANREAIIEYIQDTEDELNSKSYMSSTGFTPSTPPYDRYAKEMELRALAVETDPKGVDYESVRPLIAIRDEMKKNDRSFTTKANGINNLIKAILNYEEAKTNEAIQAEEAVYVGKNSVAIEANLQNDLAMYKNALKTTQLQITSTETKITALDAEHDNFLQNIEENEIENNKTENERRLLANDALNTFNKLNQGRIQIQREPQETDEELLVRIARLGKIQADPSDIENQILDKAKKNIVQLTPDTTKTEMILKSLSSDEQHIMNKIFPKIKKNYIETFGSNNKDLTENDISQFIKNEINSNNPLKAPTSAPAPALAPETTGPTPPLVVTVPAPSTGAPASGTPKFPASLGPTTGEGISNKVLPSSFVFGKIKIDLNKLYYRNILSIKDRKGKQINGQMNKHVSDNFVEVIFKILEDRPITKTDLKNIHSERILYDNLIVQSGIHKSKNIPTTIEDTAPEMKNRLGLITGEIEAGNSNVALLKELHELVFKMAQINLISRSAATSYYNNIKNNYFSHVSK